MNISRPTTFNFCIFFISIIFQCYPLIFYKADFILSPLYSYVHIILYAHGFLMRGKSKLGGYCIGLSAFLYRVYKFRILHLTFLVLTKFYILTPSSVIRCRRTVGCYFKCHFNAMSHREKAVSDVMFRI